MDLSNKFQDLLADVLISFDADDAIKNLVVYVAKSNESGEPSLEIVGQRPEVSQNIFPPLENDPVLRSPSPDRRWYPLRYDSILIGVLRAEKFPSVKEWPIPLERRLQSSAFSLATCLGLELDKKRFFDELVQQREQISILIHQLRNPLSALKTYAQLLLRKVGPDSPYRDLVRGLITEQEQFSKYLFALDEIGAKKNISLNALPPMPLLLPPLLPNQSLKQSLRDQLRPLIERSSSKAILQERDWISPSIWPEWSEKTQFASNGAISEIVANLLENAFRYNSKNSPIGLFLDTNGICVWDGGAPVPPHEQGKIFQKGFRGENAKHISGSGIGLSLAKELTQQLGGRLCYFDKPIILNKELPAQGNAFYLDFKELLTLEEEEI